MALDYTPFFDRYRRLTALVDTAFSRIQMEYSEYVKCKPLCSDCCYALFDLSFIEAVYINHVFLRSFQGEEKKRILASANIADREVYRLKRNAAKQSASGVDETKIIEQMSRERVRCPMLNESDMCDIYENRPLTCRVYGVPTVINGKARVCGISGFTPGRPTQTINMDAVHSRLSQISLKLCEKLNSRFTGLPNMLVPLSMTILTDYNEEYLGIKKPENDSCETVEKTDDQ